MTNTMKWMLGAALAAGALGMATPQAQAAQFGVYVGSPVAYAPPCPGPGYEWIAGYDADGYWVPGRWAFVGVRGPVVGFGYEGGFYHRDFDRDRGWDRGRNRDWDRDRDRGRDRGYDRNHDRGFDRGHDDHFRR